MVWTVASIVIAPVIQKLVDRRDKCLNEFEQYAEKWKTSFGA